MADPFGSLPFNIGDTPSYQFQNPLVQQGRQRDFPLLPADEQESLLTKATKTATSGLGYLSGILGKPGRAIRGLLGGRPDEALSLIPFSDTLGITNEENAISGKDLLHQLGVISDPHDDSWLNTIAGLGAEVATDPLTYINPFTPLTKAGSIAKAAGILPKGIGASIAGVDALAPEAAAKLASVGRTAADVTNQPLRSLASFHVPFTDMTVPIGTGARSQAFGGLLDRGVQAAKTAETFGQMNELFNKVPWLRSAPNPVPYARGLFDKTAGNTWFAPAQKIFEEVVSPLQQQGRAEVAGEVGNRYRQLEAAGGLGDDLASKAYRLHGEGLGGRMNLADYGPGVNKAAELGQQDATVLQQVLQNENRVGLPTREFGATTPQGEQLGYFPGYNSASQGKGTGGWRNQEFLPSTHPSQIAREEAFRNLDRGTVNTLYKDTRLSGPERVVKDQKAAAELIFNEYLGNPPMPDPLDAEAVLAYNGAQRQAKQIARTLAETSPEHAAQQAGIFENHPVQDLGRRLEFSKRATANAEGIHALFADQAIEGSAEGYEAANDALDRAGLTSKEGKQYLADKLSAKFGRTVTPQELRNFSIRTQAADVATKWMKPFVAPESVKPFVDAYDKVTNLFKGWVTQPFLSYHARNTASGVWQNWVSGAFDPTVGHSFSPAAYVKPYKDAMGLLQNKVVEGLKEAPFFKSMGVTTDEQATALARDLIQQHGVAGPGVLTQGQAAETGALRSLKDFAPTLPGSEGYMEAPSLKKAFSSLSGPVEEGKKLQANIEYVNRTSNFIAKLKQGYTPETAAAASKAAHLDYSQLSDFEREVARRVIPFYAWSRRNLPMVVESMINEPAKVAGTVRAANAGRGEDQYLPSYIGEGAAVPLPGAPQGEQRFLSSFGLPIEDEFIGAGASLLRGDLRRAAERLAGTTAPQIKGPLEFLTGRQFFSGRELKDLKPTQAGSLFGLLPNEVAQPLTQIIANTPASRIAGLADKLTDPRKDWATTGVNLLTGARITDADLEKAKQIEGRKVIEGLLEGSPNFREFAKVVPNRENVQNMTPVELKQYQLYLGLEREAMKASLRKQAEAGDTKAGERLQRMMMEDRVRGY